MPHTTTKESAAMTKPTHICTVTVTAIGGKCGKPAVITFGEHGEFGECAEHAKPITGGKPHIGAVVTVTAYGKTYAATVTKITPAGTVYATFTTGVGTTKTVKIA
jgi:hypothetical protein